MTETRISVQAHRTLRRLPLFAPIILLAMFVTTLALWDSMLRREQEQQVRELQALAQSFAERLDDRLQERANALTRMAKRWEVAGGTPRHAWEADAMAKIRDMPGLLAMQWLDAAGIVRWAVPLAGNERLIGTTPNRDPVRLRTLEDARVRRTTTLSPPIELIQGGTGVLMFHPVLRQGQFDGYLVSVSRLDALTQGLYDARSVEQAFVIQYENKAVYESATAKDTSLPRRRSAPVQLAAGEGRWTLLATFPAAARGQTPLSLFVLGAGIGGTLLIAAVLWFWRAALLRAADNSQLAEIVARTTNAVILTDALGRVVWVNDGFTRISGYRLEDVRGRKPGEVLQGRDTDLATVGRIRAELARGEGFREQILNYHRSGAPYWIEIEVQPIRAEDGELTGFMAIESDITARKQAELALAEQVHFLVQLLEVIPSPIYFKDIEGRYLGFNRAFERFFGVSRTDLIGRTVLQLYPHDAEAAHFHWDKDAQLFRHGGTQTFEASVPTAQGMRHTIYNKAAFHREDGAIAGLIGLISDVTERKKLEAHLRESATRIHAIHDTVIDGIVTIDARGVIDSVNAAVERMFGYASAELVGRNVNILMPEPYHSAHDGYLEHYLCTGEKRIIGIGREVQGLRKNGESFPLELAVSELDSSDERLFIGVVRDLTESKRVDRMKNEFVSTVNHELRTPLTSIRGALGLVMGGVTGTLPDKAKELLDIAFKNSERLTELINDILDIEKIESGEMKFVFQIQPLSALLKQAIAANGAYASALEVDIRLAQIPETLAASIDAGRFLQVMNNLLSNAAKFSPKGGVVEVAAETTANEVRISVADRGPGIPEEFQARMFQRFSQADSSDTRSRGGTGLGLAITKSIVERMGGRIGFETREGGGTVFFVDMPLAV